MTARGLSAMLEKFKTCDYNRCPRALCGEQPCLPVGTSDVPGQDTVKVGRCRPCRHVQEKRAKPVCLSTCGAGLGQHHMHTKEPA